MENLMEVVDKIILTGSAISIKRHRRDYSPNIYECYYGDDCVDCPDPDCCGGDCAINYFP